MNVLSLVIRDCTGMALVDQHTGSPRLRATVALEGRYFSIRGMTGTHSEHAQLCRSGSQDRHDDRSRLPWHVRSCATAILAPINIVPLRKLIQLQPARARPPAFSIGMRSNLPAGTRAQHGRMMMHGGVLVGFHCSRPWSKTFRNLFHAAALLSGRRG